MYRVINLYYAQLFQLDLRGQHIAIFLGLFLHMRPVMHTVFGLGNMNFMKIVFGFVPVFTSGKRESLNDTFLGNLLGKGIWHRPRY